MMNRMRSSLSAVQHSAFSIQRFLLTELLHALLPGDGLARTLSRAGVGTRALSADGEAAAVTVAAPAPDLAQPRDVLLDVAPQGAFHQERAVEDADDLRQFLFAHVLGAALAVDAG